MVMQDAALLTIRNFLLDVVVGHIPPDYFTQKWSRKTNCFGYFNNTLRWFFNVNKKIRNNETLKFITIIKGATQKHATNISGYHHLQHRFKIKRKFNAYVKGMILR
jgi:hypothetical protein